MELFELLAKLTLDAKEYEKALQEAESQGAGIDDVEANLDLDTSKFDEKVQEAEDTDVADPESPDLSLNKSPFEEVVTEAETTDVSDPEDPDLGLDKGAFDEVVEAAEDEVVDDPEEPDLDLNDQPFQDTVADAEDVEVADPESPDLDLNIEPYKDSLADAESETETFSTSLSGALDGIKSMILGAGIAAAIAGLVSNLSEAVDLARSIGDNIDKSSRAMSISTDAYQEWSHMLDINGASITDLNRGLMSMRKLLGGGEVSKDAAEAFDKIGLSAKIASGEITNVEDAMMYALKTLADWDTSTDQGLAERDLLAQQLFGRGGTKLNALFDGTSQDMDALIQQAHDLGLVMSEESVANAAAYNDAVTNMNASIESFRVAIVEQILPALTDVFNKVAAIVAFFNPRNQNNSLSDQFKDIDENLASSLWDIEATSGAAEKMIDKLFSMGDATKLTAEQQAEWRATAEWLKNNIPSLSEVIDTDTLSISANKDQVIALTKEWKNYAIERAKAEALKEKQEALAKKTTEWLKAEGEAARLEAEAEKAQLRVLEVAKRDFGNMPENKQAQLAAELGYGSAADLLASETGVRGMANLLGPMYTERGWSGYGSRELNEAFAEADSSMSSYAVQAQDARDKADDLKQEVEAGQQELAEYSAVLDEVVGNLTNTGSQATDAAGDVDALNTSLGKLPNSKVINIEVWTRWMNGQIPLPKAKGDWDVPYDNMPALLHRGERVLTASQARQMDSDRGGSIDMSQLSSVVEQAIKSGMSGVSVNSYLSGRDVTDDVNRNTGRQLKARRFRG